MREIKFRVYNTRERKYHMPFKNCSTTYNLDYYENTKHTRYPEQFIGEIDISGKDIFEGDLYNDTVCLSPDGISSAHNISYHIPVECEIVFKDGRYLGKWKVENHTEGKYQFNNSGYSAIPKDIEIIGNIHEKDNT
jgi:uncharacterized phage protein (TIGR01671 family)